ncbi:hypothetical protein [Vibrio parahaemolyticus]|uniref:hypothetical protein n=1 Tax=Vibrio parahaemolyticus TaxID=670 RepID=UPI0022858B70|nr:hypothetical protein [Vibrio parahaemolyticus]
MSNFQALVDSNRRLTEVVETKVEEIDQKVDEAVKAIPELHKVFYVDSVSGVDTNVGTSQSSPLKTIREAVNRTAQNGSITVYLNRNQDHFMTGTAKVFVDADDKTIVLRAYGSGDDPTIKMAVGLADSKSLVYGFRVGTKALIAVIGCTIDTMALNEDATTAWGSYGGFASRGSGEGQVGNIELVLSQSKVRLRDHQLSAHYNRVDYCMRDVVVEHLGSFTSLVGREQGISSSFYVSVSSLTITDGSKTIADLFAGISQTNSLTNITL